MNETDVEKFARLFPNYQGEKISIRGCRNILPEGWGRILIPERHEDYGRIIRIIREMSKEDKKIAKEYMKFLAKECLLDNEPDTSHELECPVDFNNEENV